MSIQVLASVKKGKPELRKKVQLCQQCLIYISIYLMLLQHCFYTFEELNNIALSIYHLYHLYQYFCTSWQFHLLFTTYVYHQVMPAVIIRQRKTFRRKDGQFIYFEDNAGETLWRFPKRAVNLVLDYYILSLIFNTDYSSGVIVNNKGEMKGSAITGPVAKECADLWPRIASNASSIAWLVNRDSSGLWLVNTCS